MVDKSGVGFELGGKTLFEFEAEKVILPACKCRYNTSDKNFYE